MSTKPFGRPAQTVGTTPASVLTSPALTQTEIGAVTAYNGSGAPVSLTIYRVTSGGTAGTGNVVAKRTLAQDESYSCPELIGHVLEPGDAIYASASSAGAINLVISGRTLIKQ